MLLQRVAFTFITITTVANLTACNKRNSNPAKAVEASYNDPDAAQLRKFNAYVSSYNGLIGDSGLVHEYQVYREAEVSRKSPKDNIDIGPGSIERDRDKLKATRAMPGGGAPDLDAAADKLISALDPVVTQLSGLTVYYTSKAYTEDKLARGKREDSQMLAEFKAASAALTDFNTQLERESARREELELEKSKASGDMVVYNTKLALYQAKGFIELFHSPDDTSNAVVIAQADAKIAELEKTLAAQRDAVAKAKQAGHDSDVAAYASVGDELTEMIGNYREMKQLGRADKFHFVILAYNAAINTSNEPH